MRLRKAQNAFDHTLIKQLKNDDPGVADFEVDGRIICDWNLKSELLSDQFSSVFTNEDRTNIPVFGTNPKPGISTIIVTSQRVIKQLRPLKPNKASGHGEIPPCFFKAYAAEIVPISADISSLPGVYHLNGNILMFVLCTRMGESQIPRIINPSH